MTIVEFKTTLLPGVDNTNIARYFIFEFQISNSGGVDVGAITWIWNGCAKQAFTDSDSFGVRFPTGANLQQRALVLGATMLLVSIHYTLFHYIKH